MKLSRIACSERPFHRIFFRLNLRKLSGIIAAQLINMNVKRGTFELLRVLYIAQEPGPLSAALRLSPPCASHCTSCTDCHPPRKTTSLLPILESSVSPLHSIRLFPIEPLRQLHQTILRRLAIQPVDRILCTGVPWQSYRNAFNQKEYIQRNRCMYMYNLLAYHLLGWRTMKQLFGHVLAFKGSRFRCLENETCSALICSDMFSGTYNLPYRG